MSRAALSSAVIVLVAAAAASAAPAAPAAAADGGALAQGPQAAEPDAPVAFGTIDIGAGPIVESVEFANRTYFKDETLRSFMLHPIPGDLNEGILKADAERLAARFQERGFLRAKVVLRVEPTSSPRGVKAIFDIDAGERAELKKVKVVGNALVPEAALKEGFFSRPPEPLGALTRAGFFHKPYLDQDAQRLVANYYKHGHLEARVIDTRVDADPALDGLSVTLRVSEGPVYELGTLKFDGEMPTTMTVEEMRAKITVKDGDIADLVTIQTQADALLEPLRLDGHPFARFEQSVAVMPPPSGRPERRAVALTLKFVRGPKPVVRDVRIAGNRGTAERVIRRDVAVEPGKPYDYVTMKKTERALMSTGFFSAVQARAIPTEDPGVIDVEVTVTEQQTWLASIAPAFDTSAGGEGLIGVGILADRNFLGTGLFVSAFLRLSAIKQNFDLTVSEPRFLDTRVSLTGEAHRREISFFDFRVRSEAGAGLRTNVPIGGGFFFGAGLGVEYGGVVPYSVDAGDPFDSPPLVLNGPDDYGLLPAGVLRNPLSLSLSWDQRDSLLLPRNGAFASVSTSYAGPFTLSGLAFLDTDASLKLFWTPAWGITLKSNTAAAGVFNPHGGEVPITDRYFLGGLGSVRGFPALSIGPTLEVPTTDGGSVGVRAGGVVRFVQNLEVEFPLWPGTPFRGFVFLDAGNTWSADEIESGRMNKFRDIPNNGIMPLGLFYSTGFGVLLETPVLPFRFEWSLPLTAREDSDRPISFFLGIGSAF